MASNRISPNQREVLSAVSTVTNKQEYLSSTNNILNVNATVSVSGGATSANQTNGSQKTQIVDGSGNVVGSTTNALDVNIKSGGGGSVTQGTSPWIVAGGGTAGSAATGVVTIQGIASMTKLLVTPDSVALPANQSVNVAQMNGVTTTMGNGIAGTGVQRVAIASDNTAFAVNATLSAETTKVIGVTRTADGSGNLLTSTTNALDVNLKTSAATNISTNEAQINGVTPLMGNGVTGTGSQRVTIASDNTVLPAVGAGATGSPVPANASFAGLKNFNGNLMGFLSAGLVGPNTVDSDQMIPVVNMLGSGLSTTVVDSQKNNITGVVVAAGATSTQTNVSLTTYNARNLALVIKITAATVATLTVTVSGNTSSSYTYTLGASTALATVATSTLTFGPGLPATANVSFNVPIPRGVLVTAVVTGTIAYGIDYNLSV